MCAAKAAMRIWRRQCGQDAKVHLSLPHTQERLNFANQNQTFGASFCVKLRQVDPILLLLCILCGK